MMTAQHSFYSKPRKIQTRIQLLIALAAVAFNGLLFLIFASLGVFWIALFTLSVTLTVIAPFFDTPALTSKGHLKYYSPLFLASKPHRGKITIHGGTLFDYVFVIDRKLEGRKRTNLIIQQYLAGLLELISAYEESGESLKIKGTSYIINERTASKIGFRVIETDGIQNFILIFNYVNLTIANSFAKGKLAFLNIRQVKTFEADIEQLLERKALIGELNERLKTNLFSAN